MVHPGEDGGATHQAPRQGGAPHPGVVATQIQDSPRRGDRRHAPTCSPWQYRHSHQYLATPGRTNQTRTAAQRTKHLTRARGHVILATPGRTNPARTAAQGLKRLVEIRIVKCFLKFKNVKRRVEVSCCCLRRYFVRGEPMDQLW